MPTEVAVERVDGAGAAAAAPALAELLVESVRSGASVGFVHPLTVADACAWWEGVAAEVAAGRVVLLVARSGAELVGTVQLRLVSFPNGLHRAEVVKLLVHPRVRRQGIGRRLMEVAETEARREARSLLVLDTATAAAERLYSSMGYTAAGVVPGYAADPDGALLATTFMWRSLDGEAGR